MFYRVDYVLGLIFFGFLFGAVFAPYTKRISSYRLASLWYAVIATLVVSRTLVYIGSALASNAAPWSTASNVFGDAGGVAFGALFGMGVRRQDAHDFLISPQVLDALKVMLAFTFAMAALAKAFAMGGMTEFFVKSGYPAAFLKFIILAEGFGAVGLFLPWATNAAIAGLSVDMFGAIITHMHNGDPFNDSAGAIGMLLRLLALATLSAWRNSAGRTPHAVRNAVFIVAAGALACSVVAWSGSVEVRHWAGSIAVPLSQ